MDNVGDQAVTEAPAARDEPPRAGRRLTRSREDRVLAGVIGGLADYFDIDPVILRVAFVVLTVVGFGVGAPLYLLAWLIIPEEGEQETKASEMLRSEGWLRPVLAFGLLGAGVLVLAASFPFDGGLTALALIGIGVILLLSNKDGDLPSPRPEGASGALGGRGEGEPAPPPERAQATSPPAARAAAAHSGTPGGRPGRPPRPRSVLGPVTLSLLLIFGGVALALNNAGVLDISLFGFLAFALFAVGAALVVGAWRGRSRGLIFLGVALTMTISASLAFPPGSTCR
jgi:phage shock protein PspC (stress-responsive transcriptional regulator)